MKVFNQKINQIQNPMDGRGDGVQGTSTLRQGQEYYSLDSMVLALNALWGETDAHKEKCGQNFSDMFCISATHNMLLRDEDLHKINFSDCFAVICTQNQQPEAQQRVALTFKLMNNDPISDANRRLCVSALRHLDVNRCVFSAFAFHMFQNWQVFPCSPFLT